MQNIEFKAELRDADLARTILRSLGASQPTTLEQTDTYYRVPQGRLKRRETTGHPPEVIFYVRATDPRPRASRFTIYTEEQARERFGLRPMTPWVVVRKTRQVFMLEGVRVHLDRVVGLGEFVEFEALVLRGRDEGACRDRVARLREALAPALGEAVGAGYADLMARECEQG